MNYLHNVPTNNAVYLLYRTQRCHTEMQAFAPARPLTVSDLTALGSKRGKLQQIAVTWRSAVHSDLTQFCKIRG